MGPEGGLDPLRRLAGDMCSGMYRSEDGNGLAGWIWIWFFFYELKCNEQQTLAQSLYFAYKILSRFKELKESIFL